MARLHVTKLAKSSDESNSTAVAAAASFVTMVARTRTGRVDRAVIETGGCIGILAGIAESIVFAGIAIITGEECVASACTQAGITNSRSMYAGCAQQNGIGK